MRLVGLRFWKPANINQMTERLDAALILAICQPSLSVRLKPSNKLDPPSGRFLLQLIGSGVFFVVALVF